jgi:hypothetical protein
LNCFASSSNRRLSRDHLHTAGTRIQEQSLERAGQEIDIVLQAPAGERVSADHERLSRRCSTPYRAGAICMVNSFRSKLIQQESALAVLTDRKHAQLFTKRELDAIHSHVPWTRIVTRRTVRLREIRIDLLEFIRNNSERLVLKPNDDYGGHGITIGWNADQADWDKGDRECAGQRRLPRSRNECPTARETFPALTGDGRIEFAEQLVDLDPLLFNGKVGSAFTRLSAPSWRTSVPAEAWCPPTSSAKKENGYNSRPRS